jgi:regulator of nucleoside diphosphate kinase
MNETTITSLPTLRISTSDHQRLQMLVDSMIQLQPKLRDTLQPLRTELARAEVLPAAAMPEEVIRMGSKVELEDLDNGEVDTYTLVYPEQADVAAGKISILVPIGMGIIGFAEGDTFSWKTPGGMRRLLIRKVEQPVG